MSGPFRRYFEMVDFFTLNLGAELPYPSLTHLEAAVSRPLSAASLILYPEAAFRDHSLDEATVARETARQWLRPDVPDSVVTLLGRLWIRNVENKPLKGEDFAPGRRYLLNP
jgi:hypothetical protein